LRPTSQIMRFHVGSDHGGVTLRKLLITALRDWGITVLSEVGPDLPSVSVDYPDVTHEVCHRLLRDRAAGHVGHDDVYALLVCGTGQGMAMSANRLAGIRAGVVADPFSARMIRQHNDANVICMGERVLGSELAKLLLREFIDARFEGGRHTQRVAKIERAGEGS
jgi:ribose 5-phosphate isomerase B